MNIEKVAVIGAGVMGASIAAHISNAGVSVYLLDIVPEGADNRNVLAETAIAKLLKTEPAAFMHKKNARLVQTGNIEDHLHWLADADWVIEAVIEDLAIKQSLYQKLEAVCAEHALISSNTSTLPLALLTKGLSEHFCQRFMITHFFNPPRYMRLLELVAGPKTQAELVDAVSQFADHRLGKGCVMCKDTPGFIANRIGIFWLQCGLLGAIEQGLTIEEADAVVSQPFGIPKSGVFGLIDLIGLDLIPHVLKGMKLALAPDDAFHALNRVPKQLQQMIDSGYTGRKGKGGFYRLNKVSGQRVKEAIDLLSGDYHPANKPRLECINAARNGGLQALLSCQDKAAAYAWQVFSQTLVYAANLIPEISDDIVAVDEAIKLGFNWQRGPFELLDEIGVDWFVDRLEVEQRPAPALLQARQPLYRIEAGHPCFRETSGAYLPVSKAEGILLLSDVKLQKPAVLANGSARLWDIGEGVVCLEFCAKMNTLDLDVMNLIHQSIDTISREFKALVIYNDAELFSAGANLGLLVQAIQQQAWSDVEDLLKLGQETYKALKYAPFPVVGAPSGLALGGGCEILLHCDVIQAHAELYIGLVEVGVGLIPGWGGCKEYLHRWLQQPKRPAGPMPAIVKTFETIGMAEVAKSAFEARERLFLAESDGITMNRSRLLADAKSRALALIDGYAPPPPMEFQLPGKTAKIALQLAIESFHAQGKASDYDVEIALQLADVLSGGDCHITEVRSEDDMLVLEREAFMQLVQRPETFARLEHMLKTGKPLRN